MTPVRTSVNLAFLHGLLGGQAEAWFGRRVIEHAFDQVRAYRRAVLEAVAGATAGDPDVVEGRMAIDDEIAVPGVLVLADFGLEQRCRGQRGKAPSQEFACVRDPRRGGPTLNGVGIERFAVRIVGELEATTIDIGESVIVAPEIEPDRQRGRGETAVACSIEIEHFLARGKDAPAEHVGQDAAQPWT